MAISQAMATSFKVQLLSGAQNFNTGTTKVYKIALFTSSATLGAGTTSYTGSTSGEVANGGGYTTGGEILTVSQVPTSSGTTAFIDFADVLRVKVAFKPFCNINFQHIGHNNCKKYT